MVREETPFALKDAADFYGLNILLLTNSLNTPPSYFF